MKARDAVEDVPASRVRHVVTRQRAAARAIVTHAEGIRGFELADALRTVGYDVAICRHTAITERLANQLRPELVVVHDRLLGRIPTELADRLLTNARTRHATVVLVSDHEIVGCFSRYGEQVVFSPLHDAPVDAVVRTALGARRP